MLKCSQLLGYRGEITAERYCNTISSIKLVGKGQGRPSSKRAARRGHVSPDFFLSVIRLNIKHYIY